MNTHRSNGSGNNCCGTSKPIMWGLEGEDLAAFERIRHFLPFKGNQTVFYEGHVCLGLYVLCKGRVKITRSSARGERLIVSILEAGEIIEKRALGQHAVHEVTCETLEPSHIALIEREPYLALVKQNSNLALKLIQMLSGEVGFQMEQLERFTFRNARERLAGLLVDLGKRFGEERDNGLCLGVNLKREELAELSGTSTETVSRLLGALQSEGHLAVNGREIIIRDVDRLARISKSSPCSSSRVVHASPLPLVSQTRR